MECPGCKNSLHQMEYEGITIESCSRCRGEWLDFDELKKISDLREVRFDPELRRAAAEAASMQGIPMEERSKQRNCPKCWVKLAPVNYGGGTGLMIDKCGECGGVWLDDEELEKVQMIVEGWDDALPEDLSRYSDRLHDVSVATHALDPRSQVAHSRLPVLGPFINACVNGALNLFD